MGGHRSQRAAFQPVPQLSPVLGHAVLHDVRPVRNRAQVPVDLAHAPRATVPQLARRGERAHPGALVERPQPGGAVGVPEHLGPDLPRRPTGRSPGDTGGQVHEQRSGQRPLLGLRGANRPKLLVHLADPCELEHHRYRAFLVWCHLKRYAIVLRDVPNERLYFGTFPRME